MHQAIAVRIRNQKLEASLPCRFANPDGQGRFDCLADRNYRCNFEVGGTCVKPKDQLQVEGLTKKEPNYSYKQGEPLSEASQRLLAAMDDYAKKL